MNGTMNKSRIHPAFPHPDRSLRRKMSPKMAMKIQIAMTQKKKMIMVPSTEPNDHSVASNCPPFVLHRPASASPTGPQDILDPNPLGTQITPWRYDVHGGSRHGVSVGPPGRRRRAPRFPTSSAT